MKRTLFVWAGISTFLLTFAACSENEGYTSENGMLQKIVFSAKDFEVDADTRTSAIVSGSGVEFAWAANDTIGILPETGAQAYFPMTKGAGTKTASFTGGGWALKAASTYAAYYPMMGKFYLNRNAVPVRYTGQKQKGNASTDHLGVYDYMAAAPVTPTGSSANFAFNHLGCLVQLKVTMAQACELDSITLSTDKKVFATEGTVDLMLEEAVIAATKLSSSLKLDLVNIKATEPNQTLTLYMMLPPADLSGQSLTISAYLSSGDKFYSEVDGKNFVAGKAYSLATSLSPQVINVQAGNLKDIDISSFSILKITGNLNGTDIKVLRDWASTERIMLDLSEAHIVEGGSSYNSYEGVSYYTKNNKIGDCMFRNCLFEYFLSPADITSIEKMAFHECRRLKDISFPENLSFLGEIAFGYCESLTHFDIPKGISSLSRGVFSNSGLKSIVVPGNIETIDVQAFFNCKELVSVTLSEGVRRLESKYSNKGVFTGCKKLEQITIPNSLEYVGCETFLSCNALKSISFPNISYINIYAFWYCTNLEEVSIEGSIESILEATFWGCPKLSKVKLPNGIKYMAPRTFSHTSLSEINLPDSLRSIESYTFLNCPLLTKVEIPENVTLIGKEAFNGCVGLNIITIPQKVTTIEDSAFKSCDGLTEIHIKGMPTTLCSIGTDVFDGVYEKATLYIPKGTKEDYMKTELSRFTNIKEE